MGPERTQRIERPQVEEPPLWWLASERPADLAVVAPEVTLTWAELADAVARLSVAFERTVEPTMRIAVVGDNSAATLVAYLAALMSGIGYVPVNSHLQQDEIAYLIGDGDVGAIWTDNRHRRVALEAAASAGSLPVVPSISLSEAGGQHDGAPASAVPDWQRPAGQSVFYTSGTTGYPKGVIRDEGRFSSIADQVRSLGNHFAAGLGPHLVSGPLYHVGPHGAVGLLVSGTPVVVAGRFEPEQVLDLIERYGVASSVMVSTHFVRLLRARDTVRRQWDLSSLRVIAQTGSSCPIDVKRAMIDWFGPVFRESYGGTESGLFSVIDSAEWLKRPGSVGQPVAPFTTVVVDDDGKELEARQEGRLYFRDATGRGISYRNDPDKTAAAHLAPGVFTLGDMGYVDDAGYIFVTGRFTDMVISGGVNIYPAECERVLLSHPAVHDVAIIGLPDEEMGERLHGFVVADDDVDPDVLIGYCRERLAHYKVPSSIDKTDRLPRTPMGKLDKRSLRASYSKPAVGDDG